MGHHPPSETFFKHVQKTETCWLWTGAKNASGYGRFSIWIADTRRTRGYVAHRWLWEQERGSIPKGLVLHHKCEEPQCVNLEHLELRTRSDHKTDHPRKRDHW